MKWRLGASVSPLFTSQALVSTAISAKPRVSLFYGDYRSYPLQRIESLTRSLHGNIDKEDEFSELGPPLRQSSNRLLNLLTKKPEPYGKQRIDSTKKDYYRRLLRAENSSGLKDIVLNLDRTSLDVRPKIENNNDGSRYTSRAENSSSLKDIVRNLDRTSLDVRSKIENNNDGSRYTSSKSKNGSNLTNLNSVTIKDVPSTVDLSQLIEAMSDFGEISSASMRTLPNGLNCCDVEFEAEQSRRRAILSGGIMVRSFHLRIRPLQITGTVTIRVKNISNKITDPAVHSLCMSFGSLEGLARTKEDAVDVFYKVKDNSDLQCILKKLNDTVINDCQWSAELLTGDSTPAVMTNNTNAKRELGSKIVCQITESSRQFCMKKVVAEDLGYLHAAILHLEETFDISNPTS